MGEIPMLVPRERELAVALMRRRATAVTEETFRKSSALARLSGDERAAVEAITRRVVDAFLAEPSTRLEAAPVARRAACAKAVRRLFGDDAGREPRAA